MTLQSNIVYKKKKKRRSEMRHCEGEGAYVSVWKIGLLVFIAISTIFQHNIMITRLIRQGKAWMDLMNW
jgi:hypothetical protein